VKKILILVVCLLLFLGGCRANVENNVTTVSRSTTTTEAKTTILPEFNPASVKLKKFNDYDEETGYKRSYRYIYYGMSSIYFDGYYTKDIDKFQDALVESYHWQEPTEMHIVSFIKHFRMQKKRFLELLEKEAKAKARLAEWGIDIDNEEHELPNVDIIYTFDKEIIDAYYRRENPVAPDWLGTERAKDFTYESYSAYLEANPE